MTRPLPGNPGAARGEQHARAKLTAADVGAIRRRVAAGESVRAVHADYPRVGWTAIQKAASGQSWQHVEAAPAGPIKRRWTERERVYLADHTDDTAAEVAAQLGRTAHAVEVERSRLSRRNGRD